MHLNISDVQKAIDPQTKKLVALSEAGRRQSYLDKMTGGDDVITLRKLVERCLDDDPDQRPPIQEVKETIETMVVSVIFARKFKRCKYIYIKFCITIILLHTSIGKKL